MSATDPREVPYFPPPPGSEYAQGNAYDRESQMPRSGYAPQGRGPSDRLYEYGTGAPPPPAGGNASQDYDQGFYPQAPTPPMAAKRKTHGRAYNPGEFVPNNGAAQYASSPYAPATDPYAAPSRSVASFDPRYDDRSVPRSSYTDVSRYPESDRRSRSSHHRARSEDTQRGEHANLPYDKKQQHNRQKRLLATVGGALAGGAGGRALGRDRFGTLAGAAAGAFGAPILVDQMMDRNKARKKDKESDELEPYRSSRRGHHEQKRLDDAEYYASRSDDEYDRRRRRTGRSVDYGRDDYDDDYDYRGRSSRLDRDPYGYEIDERKPRGHSSSPTRSRTGYGLRARSKSVVDRFRAKLQGGAVVDGDSRDDRQDKRSGARRSSRSRRDSYDDYTDSEDEDIRSGYRGGRSRW